MQLHSESSHQSSRGGVVLVAPQRARAKRGRQTHSCVFRGWTFVTHFYTTERTKSLFFFGKKNGKAWRLILRVLIFTNFQWGLNQGRRHNFKNGGINITASEASRKFFGVVPHICHSRGYNSYKERHTESLSDSVATMSYWSCSCINWLLINIPNNDKQWGRHNVLLQPNDLTNQPAQCSPLTLDMTWFRISDLVFRPRSCVCFVGFALNFGVIITPPCRCRLV